MSESILVPREVHHESAGPGKNGVQPVMEWVKMDAELAKAGWEHKKQQQNQNNAVTFRSGQQACRRQGQQSNRDPPSIHRRQGYQVEQAKHQIHNNKIGQKINGIPSVKRQRAAAVRCEVSIARGRAFAPATSTSAGSTS